MSDLRKRVAVKDETLIELRDFAYGAGITYDLAIQFLLFWVTAGGSDDMVAAGRAMIPSVKDWASSMEEKESA